MENVAIESKHAYCILAHKNWEQLGVLLGAIDDRRNDIFIHIDKKAYSSFCKSYVYQKIVSRLYYSNVSVCSEVSVEWGGLSLVDAEITLFSKVCAGKNYSRIHLISGADLPLCSQNEMRIFFDSRANEEFIGFSRNRDSMKNRLKYYHFFTNRRKYNNLFFMLLRKFLVLLQMPFINRIQNSPLIYACGSEWCSLTLRAVRWIVDEFPKYRFLFKYTLCPDEHYKQMILKTDPSFIFAEEGHMRYIDWSEKKASPKILSNNDYESLKASGCVFARKFDYYLGSDIINRVIDDVHKVCD